MNDSLALLIELARRRGEAAARALAAELSAHAEREHKLALLAQYLREYAERLARAERAGARVEALARLQRFVRRIELARAQQEREIAAGEERVQAARRAWQDAERRRRSFDAFAARRARALERLRARAERRVEDEIAARRAAAHHGTKEPPP
ncbi:MAG: flagellar export protein FliJ [Pseudomonadota bacterium]